MARVAYFFEQKPSNVGAVYRGARIQVNEPTFALDHASK